MHSGGGRSFSLGQTSICCKDVAHAPHGEAHLMQQSCEGRTMGRTRYSTLKNLIKTKHTTVLLFGNHEGRLVRLQPGLFLHRVIQTDKLDADFTE